MTKSIFDFKVGDSISMVSFNSAGGWDWSESFRITAITKNFVSAVARGDGEQHNIGHWASSGSGHAPGERIAIRKEQIDGNCVIWQE